MEKKKFWALLEIGGVVGGIFAFLWWIHPLRTAWLYIVYLSSFLLFFIFCHWRARENAQKIGIRWDNWKEALKLTLPLTVLGAIATILLWSYLYPVAFFYDQSRIWRTLLLYPIWGFIQQYIFLGIVFNRLREVFPDRPRIVILSGALLFSMVHLPNPPLMFLCFFGEIMWGWVYLQAPNLFIIALSHGIFGNLCKHVLALNIKVGANGDWYVWSKLV